jgi:hypothetical protein
MNREDIITKDTGNFKHGFHKTSEYRSWQHMKARCNNPNNHNYIYYGGRGIEVCEKWITEKWKITEVLPALPSANFDSEFSARFEMELLNIYNNKII